MDYATLILIITLMLSLIFSGSIQSANAFVNIVSPAKGEAVPAGSSLTLSGTSNDNAQFNCRILVIVNDKRPYQEATPVGPGDYSKWTFVVSPQYTEIKEGINTITSRASCDAPYEPILKQDLLTKEYLKHYSINVTGIPSSVGEIDTEEPFVFPEPSEELGSGGDDETEEADDGADEDGESEPDGSLFG